MLRIPASRARPVTVTRCLGQLGGQGRHHGDGPRAWRPCAPRDGTHFSLRSSSRTHSPRLGLRNKTQLRDSPQNNCIVLPKMEHEEGDSTPVPEAVCAGTSGIREEGTGQQGRRGCGSRAGREQRLWRQAAPPVGAGGATPRGQPGRAGGGVEAAGDRGRAVRTWRAAGRFEMRCARWWAL